MRKIILDLAVSREKISGFRLAIYLVILGEGKPVFSAIQNRVNLKLENVKSSPLGSLCWNIREIERIDV